MKEVSVTVEIVQVSKDVGYEKLQFLWPVNGLLLKTIDFYLKNITNRFSVKFCNIATKTLLNRKIWKTIVRNKTASTATYSSVKKLVIKSKKRNTDTKM